jgi:hypothetical protein
LAQQPLVFIGERSGLPIGPAELCCIALLAVAMFAVQDLSMIAILAVLLAGLLYFARWGTKPTLRTNGDYLEYRNGRILSRVKLSEISGATIKGNAFTGRALVISGKVEVTIGKGKPVQRSSLAVADAFRQPLKDIRSAIAAAAPAPSQSSADEHP